MFSNNKKQVESLEQFNNIINQDTNFEIKNVFQDICIKLSRLNSEKCKKFSFTSTRYGEGKTYVALNTAIMMAETFIDEKILFADVDFSNSQEKAPITKLVSDSKKRLGIAEYVTKKVDELNIVSTDIDNLYILESGEYNISPIGLLNSKKMNELIEYLSENFSYIIFNASPVTEGSYFSSLSDRVDGYILIAREGVTSIDTISDTEDAILGAGGKVLGVILTGHVR